MGSWCRKRKVAGTRKRKWPTRGPLTASTFSLLSSSLLLVSSLSLAATQSSGSVWCLPSLAIFLELSMLSMLSPSDIHLLWMMNGC
ncbi:hypothetical protein VNO77_18227 [Canavalia gladiata]|uniref:Uncharacterized protein n=1 Tax=Canavalia gladiata TaxID=3824 RepID=A0AAN9LQE2_CANGL